MKITSPEGLQQTRPGTTHPPGKSAGSAGFDNILHKAMEKADMSTGVQKPSRLTEPRSLQSQGHPAMQSGFMDKTARVINLMDTYAKSLSNPAKSLKDIEPALMAFIDEAQTLHEEYLSTGNTNAELKTIMEDLLKAARLEGIRFRRGDYLDSE